MKSIKNIISITSTLSATAALDWVNGLTFSPENAIHAGIAVLLAAANGVDSSNDTLVVLFESIERALKRLAIYTQIPNTPALDEMVVKIMMELVSTITLATKELKLGQTTRFMKKRFEEKDIEAVLQRLDRLTQDEARMTAAEIFKVVHGLLQSMNVLRDGEQMRSA